MDFLGLFLFYFKQLLPIEQGKKPHNVAGGSFDPAAIIIPDSSTGCASNAIFPDASRSCRWLLPVGSGFAGWGMQAKPLCTDFPAGFIPPGVFPACFRDILGDTQFLLPFPDPGEEIKQPNAPPAPNDSKRFIK